MRLIEAHNGLSALIGQEAKIELNGESVEETTQRMKEAIKFHLEGLKEGEIAIPEPSTKAVSIEMTA